MSYDTLEEFSKHTRSMRNITKNEIVNMLWLNVNDIVREKKLAFIIRGNLQWKSECPHGVNITDKILLKSNFYEMEGKPISDIRTYLQLNMNMFEIWVLIDIDIDPNNAEDSKNKIMTSLNTIITITDALSFLLGGSLQWWPGSLLRFKSQSEQSDWKIIPLRSGEERTSTLLEDKHLFLELIPFLNDLENLPPELGNRVKTAINWHSTANQISNGLNRYLNYMSSIELLGNWYYDELNKGKKTEKKEAILNILENKEITQKNCLRIIEVCNNIRNPPARTKIIELLNNFDDKDRFINVLFNRKNELKKNFYDIRSAIAHGGISEYDFDEIQFYRDRLFELRSISIRIIIQTFRNSDKIIDNLTRASLKR